MAMVFCRGCGKEIHESAKNCPHCGASQIASDGGKLSSDTATLLLIESKKKAGWIAALLNWVIPGAGYMYCGRVVLGILVLFIAVGVAVATAGVGLLVMMPILIIDGFLAANRYNKKMMREILVQAS